MAGVTSSSKRKRKAKPYQGRTAVATSSSSPDTSTGSHKTPEEALHAHDPTTPAATNKDTQQSHHAKVKAEDGLALDYL